MQRKCNSDSSPNNNRNVVTNATYTHHIHLGTMLTKSEDEVPYLARKVTRKNERRQIRI